MDEDLIARWFDLYADDVYRFLAFRLGSPDVEDLVQDVFIKAIDHSHSFKGDASPKTWLLTIARNLAVDYTRKNKVRDWRRLLQYEEYQNPKVDQSPEEIYEQKEASSLLYQFISELKPNYQEVLLLRGIEEMSVREVAAVLGWSESKVSVTYHRAIKALQRKGGIEDGSV
ncbi:RNA polymerase sigma factor [Alkalibacillus haloalkaliphilus]|uniref:RNA polymerase sigma factor n=1 Tax=Alkalibacillus haloalkaliphilus TaxID=94136 RepID=UPI0002DF7C16|nr:RNA polymerase sigma factor [Alkalibacillus haloalkaliphilus]